MEGFNYLIIGNSAAGVSAVEAIRGRDVRGSIGIVSAEDYPIYSRCLLAYYLSGEIEEERLLFRSPDFYQQMRAKPILGHKAVQVVPSENRVLLDDGRWLGYDKLLLATGASPKRLPIKGGRNEGLLMLRTVEDVKRIISLSRASREAVVIGGGLIGLKAAYGLSQRGLKVHVIELLDWLLPGIIDPGASRILEQRFREHGIEVRTGISVEEIRGRKGWVEGVRLSDGSIVPCQLVILAAGVSPNVEAVQDSGIELGRGIITDELMRTNVENIFAAGDVAETIDRLRGERVINALWPNAISQGRVAGQNMAGGKTRYNGSLSMNSTSFYDLDIISFGVVNPTDEGYESIVESRPPNYRKLVLKEGRIVGLIALGKVSHAGVMLSLSLRGDELSQLRGGVMSGGLLRNEKLLVIQGRRRGFNL